MYTDESLIAILEQFFFSAFEKRTTDLHEGNRKKKTFKRSFCPTFRLNKSARVDGYLANVKLNKVNAILPEDHIRLSWYM